MELFKKQTGVTLVELMATLAIATFLVAIICGAFINGLNYSSKAEDMVSIQQEANYLLTVLKEQHQSEDAYTFSIEKDPEKDRYFIIINKNQPNQIIVDNPKYSYQIINLIPGDDPNTITTTSNFHVKITLRDVNNPDITYSVKTILSRL